MEFLVGTVFTASICPLELVRDEKGFVHTESIYMLNIIGKKKPGLLIRLISFVAESIK